VNKTLKSNIINFLNWNDKNANIDESYSSHELLAMFIYELNQNVLYVYNWFELMEYSQVELSDQMDSDTRKAYELLDSDLCTVETFKQIIKNYVK